MSYRIGIDARLAGVQHGGIGRYIQNLVVRLVRLKQSEITWVIFRENTTQLQSLEEEKNVELVTTAVQHYTLSEQIKMPAFFNQAQLDLLHVPHFNLPYLYKSKSVITIHDLLWHTQKGSQVTTLPTWQYWIKYFFYKKTVQHAVTTAQKILVPAKTVKTTLAEYFPQAKSKIVVTKEGVDERFSQQKPSRRNPNTLLYVGSLYPHKNIETVLIALSKLKKWHLRIVSSRSVFSKSIQKRITDLKLTQRVSMIHNISDTDLIQELSTATALIQPSLSEGFGLTGVEAMAAGCPVVASDIAIFHEIYQDAAVYFDPHSAGDLQHTLENFPPKSLKSNLEKGFALAHHYNWDKMTAQTFKIYQEVLSNQVS